MSNNEIFSNLLSKINGLSENSELANWIVSTIKNPLPYVKAVFTAVPTTMMFLVVVVTLCGLFGSFFYGKYIKKKLTSAQNWPVVDGVVTISEVRSSTSSSVQSDRNSTAYYAHINYCYSVEGREYTGKKLSWGARIETSNIGSIQAYVSEFPQGKKIPVRYNPAKHEESIVEIDVKRNTFIYKIAFFMSGFLFLCFGSGFIYMAKVRMDAYEKEVLQKYFATPEGKIRRAQQQRELDGYEPSEEDSGTQADTLSGK